MSRIRPFFPKLILHLFLSCRHRNRKSEGLFLPGPGEKIPFDSITHCHDKSVSELLKPTEVVQYHLNTAVGMSPAQEAPDNQRVRRCSPPHTDSLFCRYLAPDCLFASED